VWPNGNAEECVDNLDVVTILRNSGDAWRQAAP
jgi:hypothetical protein